jgi:uncharacterized membrane protein YeaQ/YmgE (transglycosylase-associated protein family)
VGGLGGILAVVLSGFLIGGAARFAVPGPDPMPFWLTVLIGLAGSIVGGGVAAALFGASHVVDSSGRVFATVMLEIGVAAALVVGYRRFVQRRPLTGPEAYRFPTRGIGIARMRARLRQLGVDPDTRARRGGLPGRQQEPEAQEVVDELEKLRDLRDKGVLTEEEYEQARDRLRRY